MTTSIEWTDTTWNPVRGCTRVSEGCRNCYAERMAARALPGHLSPTTGQPFAERTEGGPRWTGAVELIPHKLAEPLRWRKPRRCFVNSMSDLFHEGLSFEEISAVLGIIGATPHITYQVLTKRPARALEVFGCLDALPMAPDLKCQWEAYQRIEEKKLFPLHRIKGTILSRPWPFPNFWLGVSAENQETLMERAPELEKCPAVIRFLSLEPLLGPIDLGRVLTHIDWVIAGGESGPGARPCDIAWLRSVRDQCKVAGVSVFLKQLGSQPYSNPNLELGMSEDDLFLPLRSRKGGDWGEWPEDLRVREFPGVAP